jgi:hypothetical protein
MVLASLVGGQVILQERACGALDVEDRFLRIMARWSGMDFVPLRCASPGC